MDTMERMAVQSREIAIIGYEAESETLEIVFRRGGVYRYQGVPDKVFRELMTAPSQGTYFAEKVKQKYPYQKIS